LVIFGWVFAVECEITNYYWTQAIKKLTASRDETQGTAGSSQQRQAIEGDVMPRRATKKSTGDTQTGGNYLMVTFFLAIEFVGC